ncbi:Hint domain-containing protein [Maribius pontilimi]|uniref:Hint domain-containing protein n=1 Tax=Palleronia pontilimi TaxID=1964209 RepID=A0A934M9J5_9RHOB|nr:Hint domain-containing protein [Palleronia pontilimi]MBJ3762617.1 Hint domain-containing protein [Palleronia pontilimi]
MHMSANSFSPQSEVPHARAATTGIVSGTRVATTVGWRAVEDVKPGEKVLTFDGGLQEVIRVERRRLWPSAKGCPRDVWPLTVPVGALGNHSEMQLLPDQPVMLESDAAEDIFGDPFTLMAAQALEGLRGIARAIPETQISVVTLYFATEQLVFANIGALFLCPQDVSARNDAPDPESMVYSMLPLDRAASLTRIIAREESQAAQAASAEV